MKRIVQAASTEEELERSVYAKMADALDLLEEAHEIATAVYNGMIEKHGEISSEYRAWLVDIHHAIARGDKIRPLFKYVDFK